MNSLTLTKSKDLHICPDGRSNKSVVEESAKGSTGHVRLIDSDTDMAAKAGNGRACARDAYLACDLDVQRPLRTHLRILSRAGAQVGS